MTPEMAPRAAAEARRRRDRQASLYQQWAIRHAQKLAAADQGWRRALTLLAWAKARQLAVNQLPPALQLTAEEIALCKRRFVSQERRQKFGSVESFTEAEWTAQTDGISAVYNRQPATEAA